MSIFEFVTAVLLLILGLGVTELLGDAVDAFRHRRERPMHWIPLAWAGIVFAYQMQFLWAIFELNALMEVWSALSFIAALFLALLLFVAGSLVVPRGDSKAEWDSWLRFMDNGRWSLIFLSVFCLLAYVINPVYFDIGYLAFDNLTNLLLSILLVVTFFLPGKRFWGPATIGFAMLTAWEIVLLSPSSYP